MEPPTIRHRCAILSRSTGREPPVPRIPFVCRVPHPSHWVAALHFAPPTTLDRTARVQVFVQRRSTSPPTGGLDADMTVFGAGVVVVGILSCPRCSPCAVCRVSAL